MKSFPIYAHAGSPFPLVKIRTVISGRTPCGSMATDKLSGPFDYAPLMDVGQKLRGAPLRETDSNGIHGAKDGLSGPSLAPSPALGISPAGSDARSPAQLRLRAIDGCWTKSSEALR
jgi:hypothetical protein